MDERSQTWFTLLEESSEWNENSNASQGTTNLAASTFIGSTQKQKDLPLLSRVLFNSYGQILSPIKSANTEPVQTFEKTGNLTQYTIESTDEATINTLKSNENSILQKPTKTRNSLTLDTSRPPNFNEHLNEQSNNNCSNNELGATAKDVRLQGIGSNPLTKEPTSLQFPYPSTKSMQMQVSSFEMKLSNLQGDKTDLLNLPPNHRNSLPSLFDPVLLVRTEPVGQDLSKSHRSLSAPISTTTKANEVTNQTVISRKMKDDITSSLNPVIIDSLTDQKIQYQIKDDHLDGNNEVPTSAADAARSDASSTNATGLGSNLSSVTDYMSVNDRLKLLPLTSNTVKDNEKLDEDLVDAQENTGSLFALESYSESRDRFLLLEGQSSNNTVFSASNKVSMTRRSVFDPCIRENSAPVGSESNGQSLNPGAVHLSFSDSDEEPTNSQTLKRDFDYSLPIAEQERLLPTGADSEFLEREAKSGRIKKSRYTYRAKKKISDLESDQTENISEEVNSAQLPNADNLLYSTNANRFRTTTEPELIEAKDFTRPNPDIQGSTDDISKSVDKSNIISQSLDSLNVNNHATFDDIGGLTKSFAVISNQVDRIRASIDLNKQLLESRSSKELENEDCVTRRFLQNSEPLERGLNDTSERFIYGSENSSFKISANLTPQNPSNFDGNIFSGESSILNSASCLRQPKSSLTSLLQPKDSSGNVDTEEDDTDELIRMASKLVESYSKDISDDSNQTHSSYSPHSVVNTDTSKQTHAVSVEKNDSRLSNILTESGRGTMPSSEGIVTPPQTNSAGFQNMNSSYTHKQGKIRPSKKECCKQNENVTSVDLSNSFLETNLASRSHSSNSAQQEKTSEVLPHKTNYKQKRLISTSAALSGNFPNITLSSSSSKDYTTQYDSNSSRLFDYDGSQDSDSLGRQVNNLLSRTAYLESKTSASAHCKSDVLRQSSHDKHASSLLYANTSVNSNKNSEITDGASAKSQDTSFSQLKQDLIDLQHDLNENLSIEKKQLGISDNWSPLKNLSIEDSFTHSDKDLIDFNEPRLPAEDNQGSSGLMPNSELSKFDFKNLSPSEKNTSLSLPLPLGNTKEEKKTFESLHLSWQNEDTSLKNVISFKEFFKCSGSSKNDNQKLQNKSYSTSFSSSQSSSVPNSSSSQSPYNQPPANDSLELKDDLSLRVERLLSKESSYDIPKMSCLQNVRPKEGFFPKASFELNSSSETETEPRLMEDKSSTIMPKLDKKVDNGPLINQTASVEPPEGFDYFDPLLKSNSENKVQNVSKESMKINSLNESLQKPNFNQPLIQGLKAPDNYVATSLASKISNVSQLVASGLHSKSNNDFTGVNGKNNNSKPVDLSCKDSLYATGDLKRPEDIIRNQLNSPNSETNEVFQNPTCDSLNSTKFTEDDVRKCLDWSNMTDFDSPAKERCQDTNTKHSTLFLSKSSLSQTFNNFDMVNPEPFPRSQENNSKNYSPSNSKSNLPNKPAYLSTFKETVPNPSATSEDCVDYEFLKPKASPTMLQHTELNSNENSSGNITNKILDKYQSPILHRSESFQKSSFLNQSLNADPSVRPRSSINRSHSLEEFQKPKVPSLPQKRNTYRTKPKNSSEMLSSSDESDSLKRDLHKLSADLEQDYERSVKHGQLTCSLPTRIGITSEQMSVGVSPKNQYPYSLPASLNPNRDLFEFYNSREDSQIQSLLAKYELPMESNVGSNSNNFSHIISAHNSKTASSGDGPCINSRRSKTSSDANGQSNKHEPESNTVDAVVLDNLTDSEEAKNNQESPDMYHSSSCDPRETSSQSKLNPSPSGSDSSTLSQKTWTLRPYKPPGSQDWYYTGPSGFPPFSVSDSGTVTTATTTTMESGDTE
ncbi:Hypothetical predicted protein [Octopus vulgaris]|uniref:Uncharacterized protein n=1 Tax=Octopus vulgaris TaxID=6645 RepID=A0AA36F3B3_OCTVU|nr:Hypothetical predicted protein [Octopus vulgaris]